MKKSTRIIHWLMCLFVGSGVLWSGIASSEVSEINKVIETIEGGAVTPQYHPCGPHPVARVASTDSTNPAFFSCAGTYNSHGDKFTCEWTFNDPFSSDNVKTGVNVDHIYKVPGIYSVQMKACDDQCCNSPTNLSVHIGEPCNSIVDANGPYHANIGEPIIFYAKRPGCEGVHFEWDFGDGQTHNGRDTHDLGREHDHAYAAEGAYTVTLNAYVNEVLKGTTTTSAIISVPVNNAPVANPGGPYTSTAGHHVIFDGTASSDPEGSALTYQWHFGDGSAAASAAQPTHIYSEPGEYTITLIVNDGINDSLGVTTTVNIPEANDLNIPPVAMPGYGYSLSYPGQAIEFDGSASYDPEGAELIYWWDFGDDSSPGVDSSRPTHIYTEVGIYKVTLIVYDGVSSSEATTYINSANRKQIIIR